MRKLPQRKLPPKPPEPPSLKLSQPIDDDHIWYVEVKSEKAKTTSRTPCRLTSLTRSFDASKDTWNVTVLGRWVTGDSRQWEQITTT